MKDKRKEKIKKINQKQNKNRCLLCAKFSRNAPCCCCCCCMRYPADWVGKDDLLLAAVGFLSNWDILFFLPPCCNSLSLSLYLLNKNNKYDVPNSYMCFTCIRLPDWRETVWYAGVAVQVSRNQQESRTTNEFLAHFLSSSFLLCLWYNHCTFCLFIPPCHV